MYYFDFDKKEDVHLNAGNEKLLDIISSALSYHFSLNGEHIDEDINKPIYSNIFKTIDMLMNAWLMIESDENNLPILSGLDLDIEDIDDLKTVQNCNIIIKNTDKELNTYPKIIENIPKNIPKGIKSKDLLLPYYLHCKSEIFMSRFLLEKNKDLVYNGNELNTNFEKTKDIIRYNNININFNPAQLYSFNYTNNSEGCYVTIDQLYYLNQNNINSDNLYCNKKRCDYNFINIDENINNNLEKEKRKNVYQKLLFNYGYNLKFESLNIPKFNFENYPNLLNYLSLISSYYGIYINQDNHNYLYGLNDIIKYNLLGTMHIHLEDCNFNKNCISIKKNNVIPDEINFKKLNSIKDILYLSGNYKKNIPFKLSTHNNIILTDIVYNNKKATIYELLEEFGNQSDKDYQKLWNNLNQIFIKYLMKPNYKFDDFNKLIKIKRDNINYEYKSNFRDLAFILKPNINLKKFYYVMKIIKKFYQDIEIPVYSESLGDKKYENSFPNKFRGNNNYQKLFKQRKEHKVNFYNQLVNEKKYLNDN